MSIMNFDEIKKEFEKFEQEEEERKQLEATTKYLNEQINSVLGVPSEDLYTGHYKRPTVPTYYEQYKRYKDAWNEFHPKPVPSNPQAHIIDYTDRIGTTTSIDSKNIEQQLKDFQEAIQKVRKGNGIGMSTSTEKKTILSESQIRYLKEYIELDKWRDNYYESRNLKQPFFRTHYTEVSTLLQRGYYTPENAEHLNTNIKKSYIYLKEFKKRNEKDI